MTLITKLIIFVASWRQEVMIISRQVQVSRQFPVFVRYSCLIYSVWKRKGAAEVRAN